MGEVMLSILLMYLIFVAPVRFLIKWLFYNYEKSCSSSNEDEYLTLQVKSRPKEKATVIDVNSKDIEVNSYYDESSNLLSLELYLKKMMNILILKITQNHI